MTKEELISLKRMALVAEAHKNELAAMNTYGKTTEELVDIDLIMREARDEYIAAEQVYQVALRDFKF